MKNTAKVTSTRYDLRLLQEAQIIKHIIIKHIEQLIVLIEKKKRQANKYKKEKENKNMKFRLAKESTKSFHPSLLTKIERIQQATVYLN